MPDVTDQPEYAEGVAWADRNLNILRERYSGRDLNTSELRTFLFKEAERLFRSQRDSMENDLKQDAWVAGTIRRLVDTMPESQEGLAAVFDVALEMGAIYVAEVAKHEHLESLKSKPKSWWRTKFGEAKPDDLMKPLYMRWWREIGTPKGLSRTTRWETLKYFLGSREMAALDTLGNVTQRKDGMYVVYEVDGDLASFEMIAENAWEGSRLIQGAGEIIG
jgi:hypothetical protein